MGAAWGKGQGRASELRSLRRGRNAKICSLENPGTRTFSGGPKQVHQGVTQRILTCQKDTVFLLGEIFIQRYQHSIKGSFPF